jgi:hypothetical protein
MSDLTIITLGMNIYDEICCGFGMFFTNFTFGRTWLAVGSSKEAKDS